jgi:hypothetical protein
MRLAPFPRVEPGAVSRRRRLADSLEQSVEPGALREAARRALDALDADASPA